MIKAINILNDLSRDKLPPTAMNPRRLFGSLSICEPPFPHRLPNELLSHIFLIATHRFEDRHQRILTPITISHVCSHWREVAMSTGGLWTTLVLTFPTSHGQLSRTTTWLSRSQPYPLDIFLDFRDPSWDWEENSHAFHWQEMEVILRLFLTHVKRWSHFELLTDTWAPIFTFLWYTRRVESAPLLRSLSLSRCNAYFASKGATFQPVKLKEPMPLFGGSALDALRDLSLTGVHIDWEKSSLRNLTKLEFKYHASGVMPSLDQFLDILAGCLDLRHLSIIGWGPQFEKTSARGNTVPQPQRKVQLLHLTSFTLGFIDINYALKLLSLFSFPSIESLTLEDVSFTLNPLENLDATPILEWLMTPIDSLDSLSPTFHGFFLHGILSLQLHAVHSKEVVFSHFFSALPNLRKLSLFDVSHHALAALHPSDANRAAGFHALCPALNELECRNMEPATLLNVVRSRAEIGVSLPLENVSFDSFNDAFHPTLDDRLKLTEVGIKVLSRSTKTS